MCIPRHAMRFAKMQGAGISWDKGVECSFGGKVYGVWFFSSSSFLASFIYLFALDLGAIPKKGYHPKPPQRYRRNKQRIGTGTFIMEGILFDWLIDWLILFHSDTWFILRDCLDLWLGIVFFIIISFFPLSFRLFLFFYCAYITVTTVLSFSAVDLIRLSLLSTLPSSYDAGYDDYTGPLA